MLQIKPNSKNILIFLLFGFLLTSLFSYNSADPSWSNASSTTDTHNFLGTIGSYTAGFVFEVFGLSLFGYILFGILIFKFVRANIFTKISLYVICNLSLTLILSALPISHRWHFNNYSATLGIIIKYLVPLANFMMILLGTLGFIAVILTIWLCKRRFLNIEAEHYCNPIAVSTKPAKKNVINKIKSDLGSTIEPIRANLIPIKKEKKIIKSVIEDIKPKTKNPSLPSIDFLTKRKESVQQGVDYSAQARILEGVLKDFKVKGKITQISVGPVVALYELEPSAGTKSSSVITLANDIARTMSTLSARIAIVPGRNAIGIELPNPKREMVLLREILESDNYKNSSTKLPIALGKSINGTPVVVDLTKMPHLLVAGTTGSGKSVAINAMILSLIYRLSPEECKLIMIDPKMLELSIYDNIPHLLSPVVIDPKKAVIALKWVIKEMEKRYKAMSQMSVRNIDGYNQKMLSKKSSSDSAEIKPLPFIVVIVDEMADLMLVAGKEIETSIQRLAQMARAAGIHIIMATQRPSVDVITGVIKANFPTRISFAVTSRIDSRTILNEQGAEQLLGMGDMLYMSGGAHIKRVHGPFVSDEEVQKIVDYLKSQAATEYIEDITNAPDEEEGGGSDVVESSDIYERALNIIIRDKKISVSYLQRQLQIGYNKSANIVERMEKEGVVSPPNHACKRTILLEE